ncbi:MAG: chemotaxis protein CheW [Lachnospiraceae bacterium]|nr:chemotaxis protein CheW [Lachnospiraceae bacterium]
MSRALVVMREHGTLYGLWADNVNEVRADLRVTPLPRELSYFEGICNYKGNMIPVFSLSAISGEKTEASGLLVIAEHEKNQFALSISEVLDVTEDTADAMPAVNMELSKGVLFISEIIRLKEPVFVLDMEKILAEICK